jgi:hypothetical protein
MLPVCCSVWCCIDSGASQHLDCVRHHSLALLPGGSFLLRVETGVMSSQVHASMEGCVAAGGGTDKGVSHARVFVLRLHREFRKVQEQN